MDRLLHTSQRYRGGDHLAENPIALPEDAIIDITSVERVGDYELKLRFSDGFERTLDFEPFLRNSLNPLIRQYLNPSKFADYRLEYGDLVWGTHGLCFPIADLYSGDL